MGLDKGLKFQTKKALAQIASSPSIVISPSTPQIHGFIHNYGLSPFHTSPPTPEHTVIRVCRQDLEIEDILRHPGPPWIGSTPEESGARGHHGAILMSPDSIQSQLQTRIIPLPLSTSSNIVTKAVLISLNWLITLLVPFTWRRPLWSRPPCAERLWGCLRRPWPPD